MAEAKPHTAASISAHILSDILSPLLTPTYAMVAAMWLTRLRYLPLSSRLWGTLGISAITALIPVVFIAILMKRGKVSDTSISDPNQRTAPYCATILCYLMAGAYMFALHAPMWLVGFFGGAALTAAVALLITHWWKISAHMGGIGGLSALIYWLGYNGFIDRSPLAWISLTAALAGLLAWARLFLRHHTLMQTLAGVSLSFAIVYTTVSVFSHL
ncbi:MAG: hypothetical protein K2K22_08205 [Muribaculaceae bacterium]|nr:hypothetical protein [Muribaculaceae bacterium]